MGCDIHGWVEVKLLDTWYPVIDISLFVHRNYDMFGCLFGVRNYCKFKPIAANRGIPDDVSELVKKEIRSWDIDGHSHTWITYREIKNINWDEEGDEIDERVHQYKRLKDGSLKYIGKCLWSSRLDDPEIQKQLREKGECEVDGIIYRYEKVKRKDALSRDWEFLFKCMEYLAECYGEENVRLVVWFDN